MWPTCGSVRFCSVLSVLEEGEGVCVCIHVGLLLLALFVSVCQYNLACHHDLPYLADGADTVFSTHF